MTGVQTCALPISEETKRLLEQLRLAHPLVQQAGEALQSADAAIQEDDPATALDAQVKALTALTEAREYFVNLKQLIELAYADQRRIQSFVDPPRVENEEPATALELLPLASKLQNKNIDRSDRMAKLLAEMLKGIY